MCKCIKNKRETKAFALKIKEAGADIAIIALRRQRRRILLVMWTAFASDYACFAR